METGGTGVGGAEGEEARSALGLFEYVERLHQRSPLFYNLLYTPDLDNPVTTFTYNLIFILTQGHLQKNSPLSV